MNEHFRRISAIAEDLIVGLKRDKERAISKLATGNRSKAVYLPDSDRQRKALRLVEECAEYECPPPPNLIEALRLAFLDSERQPLPVETIGEEFQVRLLSGEAGIKPKSYAAFRRAVAIDAADCEVSSDGAVSFRKTSYSVAKEVGCTWDSIEQWRDNAVYRDLVRRDQASRISENE